VVAAPVFKAIAAATLRELGVQPPAAPILPPAPTAPPGAVSPPVELARAAEETPVAPDGTPSFVGLSLREALTRAHAAGWTVRVTGSGWVTTQVPVAGTPLAGDRRLALELRPDAPRAPR
jgi:hypothetical protein